MKKKTKLKPRSVCAYCKSKRFHRLDHIEEQYHMKIKDMREVVDLTVENYMFIILETSNLVNSWILDSTVTVHMMPQKELVKNLCIYL